MKVLDQKHLLKQAACGLIPSPYRKRHKQPYRAPEGKSFFCPAGRYTEEMLSAERIRAEGDLQSSSSCRTRRQVQESACQPVRKTIWPWSVFCRPKSCWSASCTTTNPEVLHLLNLPREARVLGRPSA